MKAPDSQSTPRRVPSIYWEDFQPGDVREFGAVTVLREDIIDFASRFDPQPFHLDDAAGRASPYGGLIASGWHTSSLAMRMMCDEYLLDAASLGSPGLECLRWTAPVRPGDTLRMRLTVLAARVLKSRPTAGLVDTRWQLFNQRDEQVLDMRGYGMFARRPPQPG